MSAPLREYFYFVDREGVLHHDGTALSDERFLQFFFRRLRANDTGRHPRYRYLSPCGRELNYVEAEETVIVFRKILETGELQYAAGLTVPFRADELRVSADGRLYHAAPVGEFGLLRPALAVQLGEHIEERHDGFVFVAADGARPIAPLPVTE